MAAVIDASIGLAKETTHKNYVAPTRHFEFNSESLKWNKTAKSGRGIRVGSRVARSSRRVVPMAEGGGDFTVDVMSRGMGVIWEAVFGQVTDTEIVAGAHQQVFTFADDLPSYTIQKGVVRADGTVDGYSFLGSVCSGFEIDSPNGELITAKLSWDIADLVTSQAYVAPSYPAEGEVMHFGQVEAVIGGIITPATTTEIASSAIGISPLCVRDFNVQVSSNLDNKRFCYGGGGRKGRQISMTRQITGKFTAEYNQTDLRDAFLNDTDVSILFTATGSELVTGHNAVFQVVLPVTRLNGDIPEANADGVTTIEHSFEVFDGLVQEPMTLVCVTADTAI